MSATSDYGKMQAIASSIVAKVKEKGEAYGDSWRARGGAGAFMVMARKWDRIENICRAEGWDIFDALDDNKGDVRDDVQDLVGYLLLILEHTAPMRALPRASASINPQSIAQALLNTAGSEHWSNEGYYGDNTELYKCRRCGGTVRQAGTPPRPHVCGNQVPS